MAQLPPFQEMESLNLLPGGWGGLKRKRPGKASKQAKEEQDSEDWVGSRCCTVLSPKRRWSVGEPGRVTRPTGAS